MSKSATANRPESRDLVHARAKPRIERRDDATPPTIEGYGAVFFREGDPTTEYELWQDNFERILPGAFDGQLDQDVRSLFNHDRNWVLGRSKSDPPTLVLSVDDVGLRYVVTPPDTQAVRDQVIEPIRRGDVSGASFMFWPQKATWIEEDRDARRVWIRQLEKVQLIEVGPVTFPAYSGATSGVRVRDAELPGLREERATFANCDDDVLVRARLARAIWDACIARAITR